ncbi:MAG: vWA domain-containing protein [Acidimicrobiia bacterium]
MQANVRFDHHLLAVESEHTVHCMLELDAPAAPAAERPPLQLALVIDCSGSMTGPKLSAARTCAGFLASRLTPADQLALVAFDDDVQLVAPLAPVDPATLAAGIAGIRPGGMTNLSGGWLKGIEELGRATGDGTRRVLLLTDGRANVGITRRHQLLQIAAAGKGHAGTTTIGFGEGFDEDLLGGIAEGSGANAYFAETPEDAPGIFAAEFDGLASLVART